jgi:hypothetical protein
LNEGNLDDGVARCFSVPMAKLRLGGIVFLQPVDGDRDVGESTVEMYVDVLIKIYDSRKPVIAWSSETSGGRNGTGRACDIVVASDVFHFR